MKKLTFILVWWLGVTSSIIMTATLASALTPAVKGPIVLQSGHDPVIASSEEGSPHSLGDVKGISTVVEGQDARPTIVANFLKRHESPLVPYDQYGQKIVDIADKYGIDFRLIPAIAMQESNLCKKIPPGSYNCLGFGIHERGTLEFESYEANFDRAARELKANYIDGGRTTPEQIMHKYTPGSNGSWADSVTQWMHEMEYDDYAKGKEIKTTENVLEYANPSIH